MIRAPRGDYQKVRASITFLTSMQSQPMAATVLSVNGSASTARIAALAEIRRRFRAQLIKSPSKRDLDILDQRLRAIQEIES